MRKNILFLASLFVLTACVGGDSDCPWCTWQFASGDSGRSVAKPTALDATPDDMRQNNSNVIKSANIISSVNRILDVYEQSGLDYSNIPNDELPALAEDSRAPVFNPERKVLNGLTDAQIRKLREAIYVFRNVIDWNQPHDDAELAVMIKLMNAVYNIESGGKIKNKFDPSLTMADISNMSPQERDKLMDDLYFGEDTLYTYVPNIYDVVYGDKARVSTDVFWGVMGSSVGLDIDYDINGKMEELYGWNGKTFVRDGDTNVFRYTDGDEHTDVTLDSASNGKLTYADFGYMTVTDSTQPDIGVDLYMMWHDGYRVNEMAWRQNNDMTFKGRAIGLYSKEFHDSVGLKNPITMQTDNATLNVNTRYYDTYGDAFRSQTLFMPFSESGWYDVTVNTDVQHGSGIVYEDIKFTNYSGADDTNRLSIDDKSSDEIVMPTGGSWLDNMFFGDNVLDLPAEVSGVVVADYDDGAGNQDYFRAVYGMTRQE